MKYKLKIIAVYLCLIAIAASFIYFLAGKEMLPYIYFFSLFSFRLVFFHLFFSIGLVILDCLLIGLYLDFPLKLKSMVFYRTQSKQVTKPYDYILICLVLFLKDVIFYFLVQKISFILIFINLLINLILILCYQRHLYSKFLLHLLLSLVLKATLISSFI